MIIEAIYEKMNEAKMEGLSPRFLHLGREDYDEFWDALDGGDSRMAWNCRTSRGGTEIYGKFHGLGIKLINRKRYLSVKLGAKREIPR